MPRRVILTARQRAALPDTTESVIRHCTLDEEDRALVFERRGAHNRLGFAVQLCALRHPGRLLAEGETPPEMMLRFLADQVDAAPSDFAGYGRGAETGRRHAAELLDRRSLRRASVQNRRAVMVKLENRALDRDEPACLIAEMVAGFREAGCALPSLETVERDCRDLIARTRRAVWTRLTAGLLEEQTTALDALLAERADERVSMLAWLRHAPQAARPGQIGAVFDRLERIRAVGIDRARRDLIPRRRFEALVEEARRVPVQHLAGHYGALRRRALLVAAAIDLEETLIDHGLDLMGRFLGNLFNRSDHAHAAGMQSRGNTIAEQLRMHVALVETLADAKAEGADAFASIEAHLGWARSRKRRSLEAACRGRGFQSPVRIARTIRRPPPRRGAVPVALPVRERSGGGQHPSRRRCAALGMGVLPCLSRRSKAQVI